MIVSIAFRLDDLTPAHARVSVWSGFSPTDDPEAIHRARAGNLVLRDVEWDALRVMIDRRVDGAEARRTLAQIEVLRDHGAEVYDLLHSLAEALIDRRAEGVVRLEWHDARRRADYAPKEGL